MAQFWHREYASDLLAGMGNSTNVTIDDFLIA
jgi:hypothetical protein